MKKTYSLNVGNDFLVITKPLRKKVMRDTTIIFLLGFIGFSFFFTNGFKILEPAIVIRNVSIPFVFFLLLYIRKYIRYKNDADIKIEKQNYSEFLLNGRKLNINTGIDYIRIVGRYGNSAGTPLYTIKLVAGGEKILIARNLYYEQYLEISKALNQLLSLEVKIVDFPSI